MSQFDADILLDDGKIGVVTVGDVLDASGYDTYLKARGATNEVHIQNGAGQELANFSGSGMQLLPNNSSTPSAITVGVGLGVKNYSGVKLMEVKSSGDLVISGNTFYTTQTSVYYSASGSFDGFDFAELIPCDKEYPTGTVVCPGPNDTFTLCIHDNCPFASILSFVPGVCLGQPSENEFHYPIALVGRVVTLCDTSITTRRFVVSNGKGGVRAVLQGEIGFALGFTLHDSNSGSVGIQIRLMPVIGK